MATVSVRPVALAGMVFASVLASGAQAAEPRACQRVNFADVGWTDIAATTAVASTVLGALGYEPKTELLALPVTFSSMKGGKIDVFLGNWMASMEADVRPYLDEGSIEQVRPNLTGAKYTLAVPKYVADAGLKDFKDIAKFKDKLEGKIYGIEPGNDGNRLIQTMIDEGKYDLKGFTLVESSEQGMLAQVKRAERRKEWMVFLGWEPHPMNANHELVYLSGGADVFGPDFGGATIYTTVRKGYQNDCPNVGRFLSNMEFSLAMENEIMGSILNDGMEADKAARAWLAKNPQVALGWLDGVTTLDGQPAKPAVEKALKK